MASWWRKFKRRSEGRKTSKSRYPTDKCLEKGSTLSESALQSLQVSRCHSFSEEPHAQPLPRPRLHSADVGRAVTANDSLSFELRGCCKTLPNSPISGHGYDVKQPLARDAWGDLATASVSSNSSIDTNDQHDSQFLNLQSSDYDSGTVTAINSPSRDSSSIISRRILKGQSKPDNLPSNDHIPLTSTERGFFGAQVTKLQIAPRTSFFSAPGSSMSSPSRSPVKACGREQVIKSGSGSGTPCSDMKVGSGHCSYLDCDKISGLNVVTDLSSIWPHRKCSAECSPIPSPRLTSPSRGCHIQNGGVTPLHPFSGGIFAELSMDRPDDGKPESHKLPLPPVAACSSCPISSSHSAVKTPTPTRNQCQADQSTSPVSRWKKGRLIGSGTFGQVYLGFNSDTGEMCAMKEVTLLSDDSKSEQSAQQLGQEVALLSRLRHPNIVRYFGSEMVDDKLCIYLEYVSGGSVYKILQEYGELGESAIRSYTQQILSGLVYLHSKNTVHRDIKGANILVDPSGRVKLADFGMAKHITGRSCPFSFKGSPYWMAPEVIKNSDGCNLAVDIWSLGCTVIEMATTKAPWSQYEGVAALFKIGNSKESPPIPEHLSEEGKDFVWKCLQRNPRDRSTAIQLLEHPFVRNATSPERWMQISDPLESHHTAINAEQHKGKGHAKTILSLDLEGVATQLSRGSKNGSGSRDTQMSKHISCPASPVGSPLLHLKSSQTMLRKSPVSKYQTASGSSTPCTNANGAFLINRLDHLLRYPHDIMGTQGPQNSLYVNGSPFYFRRKQETLSGVPEASQVNGSIGLCQNDVAGSKHAQLFYQKPEGFCNRQSVLASRVSQQLLMDHLS